MTTDAIVIGAGILGQAIAFHLARRGRRVLVLERSERVDWTAFPRFGAIWPIGQPAGPRHRLAVQSRAWWLEVLNRSKIWYDPVGSLHLAYAEEEEAVLREFAAPTPEHRHAAEWLDAESVLELARNVNRNGLRGGMFSGTEICIDPSLIIRELPDFLGRECGIEFQFDEPVQAVDGRRVTTSRGAHDADQVFVCTGDDFEDLFAPLYHESGLVCCKLQMLECDSCGVEEGGPMLAAGLTLVQDEAFATCRTLPALRRHLEERHGEYLQHGIHVTTSHHGLGTAIVGGSQEYGGTIEPTNQERIDELVLQYLQGFLNLTDLRINQHWHGHYAKHPTDPYWTARPMPGVTIVTGLGVAGMTLAFGVADQVVREALGDAPRTGPTS